MYITCVSTSVSTYMQVVKFATRAIEAGEGKLSVEAPKKKQKAKGR